MKNYQSLFIHGLCGLTALAVTLFNPAQISGATCAVATYGAAEARVDGCDSFGDLLGGHALFIPDIDPNVPSGPLGDGYRFVFTNSDPGVFAEHSDCTATLTGTVVSTYHSNLGFRIDIKFTGRTTDSSGGMGPHLELHCGCYIPPFDAQAGGGTCAGTGHGPVNPASWHFYSGFDAVEATLYGTGDYAGAVVQLTPFMHYFQVGDGASGKNVSSGAAGWFKWQILHQPNNPAFVLRDPPNSADAGSFGDININLDRNRPQFGEIGDTVFCDTNKNGIQDNGEQGIPGVKVDLFANCGGPPIQTMFTDQDGDYLFTSLPAGNYCVTVDQTTVPTECSVPKCQTTYNLNLAEGQSFLDADFCFTPPCPACVDPDLGLGAAARCTVLQLGGGKIDITGPAGGILGDVCVGPNSILSMSGDEYVTGTIKLDAGAKFNNSSHGTVNVMTNMNLGAQITAAKNRSTSAAALPATQTFLKLDGKMATITGAFGVNVIKVGDITLSGKQITLTGPPGTKFIINVTGKMNLTGGGNGPQIRAGGSVQPKDILFNIIGTGSDVAFSGGGGGVNCCQAIVDGTLLAPLRNINLAPGLVNGEIISGKNISIVSGSSVRCPICH